MANTTVSQSQVDGVAKKHDDARDAIESRLKALEGGIGGHLPESKSDMAQAVNTVYGQLQHEIKRKIMADLQQMSEDMRAVANEQVEGDQTNSRGVTHAGAAGSSPLTSYLGG